MTLHTFLFDLLSDHDTTSAAVQILEDNAKVCINRNSSPRGSICDEHSSTQSSRSQSNRWSSSDSCMVTAPSIRWKGAARQQSEPCLSDPRRWDGSQRHSSSDSCIAAPRRRSSNDKQLSSSPQISTVSLLSNEAWDDFKTLDCEVTSIEENFLKRRRRISSCTVPPKLPLRSISLSQRNINSKQKAVIGGTSEPLRIRTKVLASRARNGGSKLSVDTLRKALGCLAPLSVVDS